MKKYCIVLTLLFVSLVCKSQSNLGFYLKKYDRKESTYDDIMPQAFDIENASVYTLNRNPAFIHLYYNRADSTLNDYTIRRMRTRNLIVGSMAYSKTEGDYNFYDGNRRLEGEILAAGEIVIESLGTLYGSASYTSERKKNVYLNYATNPIDYYPYIVSDTVGTGSVTFEKYEVDGGFGFRYKGLYYGVGASYKGISSYKLTDPRLSVYTSWFRFNFGVIKVFKNSLLSAKLYPELNRQNISATNYKQQTAKFFQFYGFGAWNKNESKGGYNYGRQMTITGMGIDFTYKRLTPNQNSLAYSVNLVYNYRKMDAEEDTFKNLFTSYTHHIKPEITLSKRFKDFDFHLLLTGDNNLRNGSEHIYESQTVSDDQKLNKYIKVGTNDMYSLNSFSNSLSLKTIYRHTPKYSYHLLGGVDYSYYQEEYVMPVKRICNQSVALFVGGGFNGSFNKNNLEFSAVFSSKKSMDNVFDLPALEERVSILQTYIPYLIRGEDSYSISTEAIYSYSINNKNAIGGKLSLIYKERTDAPYVDYLTAFKNSNRELLTFNCSLFYLF